MRREKQIDEMARITKAHCKLDNQCGSCHWETCNDCFAEILYTAGYRKQEWISVDERLPVPYADVIVYDKASGVIMDSMLSTGEFVNGLVVTHWMPLPEPPKKGGAE